MSNELSVGIIMDGNRRWATSKGLSSSEGHKAGSDALVSLLREYSVIKKEWGVAHYIFYAFSTENWKRSEAEASALMKLLKQGLSKIENELSQVEHPPRIIFIGNISSFEEGIHKEIKEIEDRTKNNVGTIAIALSYGGRDEIVRAIQRVENISEENISRVLDTASIPDPDIIIRTGGERRLSNFLLWQSAYSELFFIDMFWPDFTKDTLIECVKEYNTRERRHGI